MKNSISNSFRFIPAALGLAFCLLANHAGAAVTTWDPQGTVTTPNTHYSGSSSFYTGNLSQTWENAEWSTSQTGQASPVAWTENTAAQFAVHTGTGTPAFTVTMNANHTVAGIFSGPLTPNPAVFTIAGTGTIILPAGLQGFDISSNTSNPGEAIINVPMTDAGGANACELTAESTGQIFLNVANSYSGGTLWGYSGSSFTGIININAGAWSLPGNSPFGSGGICFSNTGTSISALVVNGTAATVIPNNITNAGSALPKIHIVAPSGGLTFSGEWDVNGQAQIGASIATVTQTGVMKGAGGFSTLAGVSSPSTFALNGANTYTGPTTNVLGTLAASTIADSVSSGIGLGTILTLGGGTFQYTGAAAATTTRACWLTAASTLDLPAGNLTLNGAFKSSSSGQQLTKSSAGTLTLGGAGDNSSLALNVTGGKVVLAKTSGSSVHGIGGATTVGSGGTLQLGSGGGNYQIYSGVALTVASGGVFDANGQTDSFTSLTMSGNGGGSGALINNSGTTAALTCTAAGAGFPLAADTTIGGSGNITLTGVMSGAHALTYSGSGTLTLNSVNTYSGNTTISAGTLAIASAGQLNSGSYAGAIANSGTFTYNSSASQTLSGGMSGARRVERNRRGHFDPRRERRLQCRWRDHGQRGHTPRGQRQLARQWQRHGDGQWRHPGRHRDHPRPSHRQLARHAHPRAGHRRWLGHADAVRSADFGGQDGHRNQERDGG